MIKKDEYVKFVLKNPLIYTLFTAIISICCGLLVYKDNYKTDIENIYINWIYYILIGNLLLWLFASIRTINTNLVKWFKIYLRKHKLAIILSFILVVIGTVVSKPDFRILADETNLLSVSQAFYENREYRNFTSVNYFYFGFKDVICSEFEKRPALFPLAVCFAHSILGYRPENIFVVNIISAFFTLLFLYHLISYRFGRFWGICSMLLLASYPLFVIYYTSGGFEVFNLLFSLIFFWQLIVFIKTPNAINAEALLLLLPLISQTRYESVTTLICALPVVLIKLPIKEYLKFGYKLVLLPLFFIPIVWHRVLTYTVRALESEDKGDAFSLEHFMANLGKAFIFFQGKDIAYGVVPIITFVAIAGFSWLIFDIVIGCLFPFSINKSKNYLSNNYYRKKLINLIIFWSSVTLFYIFHAVIRLAFWGGDFTLRSSSRLAIILLPIFVYFAIKFCYLLSTKFKVRKVYCLISIISLLFIYYPVAGQNLGVRDLTLYREFRATREYLSSYLPDKKDYILIVNRENMYVPLKYNAFSFEYFRNNYDYIKSFLNNRTYTYIIIVQKINKLKDKPIDKCVVPNSLNMTLLYETQITAEQFLRVSKCTGFRD